MIAQYNVNNKLQSILCAFNQQRKKWRVRRRNLLTTIIQNLKNRNRKLQQISFNLILCLNLLENKLKSQKRNRRFRRFPRNNILWWESVWNDYSDECFKQTFRLSRSTFCLYCHTYNTNW